jgi:hypothetical protein
VSTEEKLPEGQGHVGGFILTARRLRAESASI